MKHIKLFENFNSSEDILSEIKFIISHLCEDYYVEYEEVLNFDNDIIIYKFDGHIGKDKHDYDNRIKSHRNMLKDLDYYLYIYNDYYTVSKYGIDKLGIEVLDRLSNMKVLVDIKTNIQRSTKILQFYYNGKYIMKYHQVKYSGQNEFKLDSSSIFYISELVLMFFSFIYQEKRDHIIKSWLMEFYEKDVNNFPFFKILTLK